MQVFETLRCFQRLLWCCAFVTVIFEIERLLVVVVVTPALPRDGGMVEDHGTPEAGKLPRVWTRDRRETKSRQRVSGVNSP